MRVIDRQKKKIDKLTFSNCTEIGKGHAKLNFKNILLFFDQSLISWNRVASSFTRTNLVFVVNLFSFTTIGQEEGPRKQFRLWSIYWIILVWLTDLIARNLISSEHLIHTCPYVPTRFSLVLTYAQKVMVYAWTEFFKSAKDNNLVSFTLFFSSFIGL